MPATRGADIQIVEETGVEGADVPAIKPNAIRVNGVDVGLIEAGSLRVDPGGSKEGPTRVTFTLLAKSVSIYAE